MNSTDPSFEPLKDSAQRMIEGIWTTKRYSLLHPTYSQREKAYGFTSPNFYVCRFDSFFTLFSMYSTFSCIPIFL